MVKDSQKMPTRVDWGGLARKKSTASIQKNSLLIKRTLPNRVLTRPDWDEYFLKMAALVSERSTCLRRHVGAVVVKDKHVIATGYNGAPAGMQDCTELGCLREQLRIPSGERHELCRGIHAEQNAIIQIAKHGGNIQGATVYCTHTPCVLCAKMLANCGISRFVTSSHYADDSFISLFKAKGIAVTQTKRPSLAISTKE